MAAKTRTQSIKSQAARATLSQVAKLARVSLMTASYAMRNNPKISQPTRERVQRAAKKLGYVPNPEIGRLMHLLRVKRMPSFQATLGFLSFTHAVQTPTHRFTADLISGARNRATLLGYSVDLMSVDVTKLSQTRLTTMLRSRGIRGVLIPPLPAIEDCSQLVDWSLFSIVAATYSAQNLIVNRVVPHHPNNIMQALSRVRKLGYRRPGLALGGDLKLRANSAYQASLALHQQAGDFAVIPALSLDLLDAAASASDIRRWFNEFRPDVILTIENALPMIKAVLGVAFVSKVGVCLLDHSGTGELSGIHQHPYIIGETAVDLLAGQVQRGEIGFEKHPRVTMVEGGWIEGSSLCQQKTAVGSQK